MNLVYIASVGCNVESRTPSEFFSIDIYRRKRELKTFIGHFRPVYIHLVKSCFQWKLFYSHQIRSFSVIEVKIEINPVIKQSKIQSHIHSSGFFPS